MTLGEPFKEIEIPGVHILFSILKGENHASFKIKVFPIEFVSLLDHHDINDHNINDLSFRRDPGMVWRALYI